MPASAVSQNNGFQQSSPPQIVDMIDRNIRMLQQIFHDIRMTAVGCRNKRRAAETVRQRRVRSRFDRKLDNVEHAFRPRVKKRVVGTAVPQVYVGPRIN